VNVLTDAYVTDQGIIEGKAHELLRARSRLEDICGKIKILADVRVKHASPLSTRPMVEEALDAYERGGADAIVITGSRTGVPPTEDSLMKLRRALKDVPIFLGSGVNPKDVSLLTYADGAIVGTYFKEGAISTPVSVEKVKSLVVAVSSLLCNFLAFI
jgi:membrane complex biogenesis BtpA family protein